MIGRGESDGRTVTEPPGVLRELGAVAAGIWGW